MSSNLAALPPGTRLQNGAFAVGQVLGQGGFGITYKGGDVANKRYVAIKEFFPPGASRQGTVIYPSGLDAETHLAGKADFLREAQTLSRFQDPSIVKVISTFEENNSAYMVMEFLEGQTLAARIKSKGALDEWETLDIGLRLADALQIVHAAGILHRDIKPDNVMLARDGRAVLIDFGTAREFGGAQAMTQIITPGYAPLEQYAAQGKRGPATDIYALGATLYHALSGTAPIAATDRAADVPLPPLREKAPQLTPIVAKAVMKALDMDMARRPQSAQEFADQLQGRISVDELKPTYPSYSVAMPSPSPSPPRRHVAVSGAEKLLDINDSSTAIFHSPLEYHAGSVNVLAFDLAGTRLISAGADRLVCVWNRNLNGISTFFQTHEQPVTALVFSPDGVWIASGSRDEKVCLWDATLPPSPKRLPIATLNDGQGIVHWLGFCPTRRELLVGGAGAVTLWDANTGGVKARRDICGASLSWSPDGNFVAVGGLLDGNLQLCSGTNLAQLGQISAHSGTIAAVSYSPDGTCLATAGSDGFLRLWNASNGSLLWEQASAASVNSCLAWSPDDECLPPIELRPLYCVPRAARCGGATPGTNPTCKVWLLPQVRLSLTVI